MSKLRISVSRKTSKLKKNPELNNSGKDKISIICSQDIDIARYKREGCHFNYTQIFSLNVRFLYI